MRRYTMVGPIEDKYRLPLFVVPGMPRAGTTFLYHNLQKHPQILLPFRKEIDFFNDIYHYRGVTWYNSLFREIQGNQIAGDLSPACWFCANSIEYIREYGPGVKIVLSIRDPAEFTVSLYAQKLTSNYDLANSIEDFIEKGYLSKLTQRGEGVRFNFDDGAYINTIESYKKAFGKRVLLYDFRLFRQDTYTVLKQIEAFLGIQSWFTRDNYDNLRINESYRRNIKIVNFLFTQEWLRDAVERYVPRLTAMRLRGFIDRISVRTKSTENMINRHKDEDLNAARPYFPESRSYYQRLFKDQKVFLGDGTSLDI